MFLKTSTSANLKYEKVKKIWKSYKPKRQRSTKTKLDPKTKIKQHVTNYNQIVKDFENTRAEVSENNSL